MMGPWALRLGGGGGAEPRGPHGVGAYVAVSFVEPCIIDLLSLDPPFGNVRERRHWLKTSLKPPDSKSHPLMSNKGATWSLEVRD